MMKKFPNRSLLHKTDKEKQSHEVSGANGKFCPIATSQRHPSSNNPTALLQYYRELTNELKHVRGKLYVLGIDPNTNNS